MAGAVTGDPFEEMRARLIDLIAAIESGANTDAAAAALMPSTEAAVRQGGPDAMQRFTGVYEEVVGSRIDALSGDSAAFREQLEEHFIRAMGNAM